MAQRVHVLLTDDFDGTEASRTLAFAFEGVTYEIDLSDKNLEKFRKSIGPYVEHARRVGGRAKRGSPFAAPAKIDNAAVRSWAQSAGYEVSSRGRISKAIVEAYEAAQG
jgi:hypothetical protein